MKKLLAIVISMAMLVAMMPMGVFAGEGESDTSTGGSESIHTENGIIAAHLTDNATDNPVDYATLNDDYSLVYNEGTITINVKGISHENGNGDVGKWVGIAVPIHSDATSLVWNVNGGADINDDLSSNWPKDGVNYATFYWAYDKTDVQKIKYTFKNDDTEICSEELNVVVNATGNTDVAKIGNRYFATLQEAIDADGNTIEVAEIASIDSGNTTIDLKGKTLVTRQIASTVISGGAELHIINGTIDALNAANNVNKGTNALFNVQTASKLFVEDMKINTTGSALFPQGSAASVDVNNSTINAGVYAVGTNASTDDNYKVVITLKDSTFNVSGYENNDNDSCAVMINVEGTLNIDNCDITGGRQGVVVRAGTAKIENSKIINNCTYKGSGKDKYDNADWSEGNELPMAGLLVGNYKQTAATAYKKAAVATVTDTIISVPSDSGKPAILVADNSAYEAVLNLGGTDTNVTGDIATKIFANSGSKLAITGGTFTSNPSEYVAEGYTVSGDTAPYTVVEEAAEGSVIPAPLVDKSENPITGLDKDYKILYDGNTVTINVKPQLHTNGANPAEKGKWIGIAVPVPESATTVDYHYSDRQQAVTNYDLAENKEIWKKDGKDNYMSFYWDYAARNVEWIKYKFNGESKFHKVNIVVNATPTAVEAAPLHDNAEDNPIADNALYSKYKVDYANGTATITVKGLKEHYNGQEPAAVKGKWVGIAVPADCKEADTHLIYKYDDGDWNKAPLNGEGGEKWTDKDGKAYVSFYMNAATVKARTISYAFGTLTAENKIPATVTGVNTVKVNVVEESEYTGGGAVVPPATDNVTNNPADKKTTADLTPAVKDNKAETTVDAKTADKIVDKAVENKSTEVVIDAAGNNNVASSEVAIPEKTVKELAEKTDANLVIKTDNGKVDLDKTALEAVAAQAGTDGTVKLVVETVKTDENICHVDLKLVTSNGAVKDFNGGIVTVTITLSKELAAKDVVCVYINDNGIYTLVNGQKNADGTYTFTTGHFSEYAVMAKDEADKKIAEQLNTLIKDVNLKVRTSKTSKKNIKAVVSGDVKAITDAGYTVKYKFYRSEKKASKYEAKATKAGKTYINTAGKKGTKYYYKAKALVYQGDKLVGQTVLKQCKYGVRTWSK